MPPVRIGLLILSAYAAGPVKADTPKLPGPALALPVDVDGDGLSEYGDKYAFNYWLELGGDLEVALSAAQGNGETLELTEFFKSEKAQLPPNTNTGLIDSLVGTPESYSLDGFSPLGPFACPDAVRPDAPDFTRRIPAGADLLSDGPTTNARTTSNVFAGGQGGRHIVFSTRENISNIQPPPQHTHVFRFSRSWGGEGEYHICSVDSTSAPSTADCISPDISDTGEVVAFSTLAALAPNDSNGVSDIYIHDFRFSPPRTRLMSRSGVEPGTPGNAASTFPSVSADGTKLVFTSFATNLGQTAPLLPNIAAVYITSTTVGGGLETRLISRSFNSDPELPNAHMRTTDSALGSAGKVISSNGRFVLFQGRPSNWTFTNLFGNTHEQIFLVDLTSSQERTILISRLGSESTGIPANGNSRRACMNTAGTVVAFSSFATNIDPHADTREDVFFMSHAPTPGIPSLPCRKLSPSTGAANGNSLAPSLSDAEVGPLGGPFGAGIDVAFQSTASNWLPNGMDSNNMADIYVARIHPDPQLNDHIIIRFSVTSSGQQATGGHSTNPDITGDGKHVVYQSAANDLIPDDVSQIDVFETLSPQGFFVRGDANSDFGINVADPDFILTFLFQSGATPPCLDAADIDDNGLVEITDAVLLFQYLFQSGAPPPCPFECCGEDPNADELTCAKPAECPESVRCATQQ